MKIPGRRLVFAGVDFYASAKLMDATIVIPVYNQLHFTRQCLDSLNAADYADGMIVVVNNASTDGTADFLASRPALRVINNAENHACAAAWNQGFAASTTEWTMFLNNDVMTPPGWLAQLIDYAERAGVDIASPGIGEGELDYDLAAYAEEFTQRLQRTERRGIAWGAAFAVSRAVFEQIGGFDENFRRGGNEDDDFFMRARQAGFKLAVSGSSYLHHFGNTTQKAVVAESGPYRAETIAYFRQKWKLTWAQRRWLRTRRKLLNAGWRWRERLTTGHTLLEYREGGKIFFR